jgi:hypothetical protein
VGGRLLERLEEGVGGGPCDLVGLVDDVELRLELGRREHHPLAQVADVVDAAVAGGVDLDHVGRRAGVDRDAGGADVARAAWRGQGRGS